MFKYIIVRNQEQKEVAILFSKTLVHKQVASLHSSMFGPWVVSAGFVTLSPEGYVAVGESETLRLKSRPEDTQIIRDLFQE